jgi:hypothetical protein
MVPRPGTSSAAASFSPLPAHACTACLFRTRACQWPKRIATVRVPSLAEDMSRCASAPSRARAAPRNAPAEQSGRGGAAAVERASRRGCGVWSGSVGHEMHRTNSPRPKRPVQSGCARNGQESGLKLGHPPRRARR